MSASQDDPSKRPAAPGSFRARPDPSNRCCNVLFLCRDNSTLSIIAEALLKRWGGKLFRAFSAGLQAASGINPMAAQVLKSQRVWRDDLRPRSCDEFAAPTAPPMEFVSSVGERPPEGLPSAWPGNPRVMHWRITEPLIDGGAAAQANGIRKSFAELETRIKLFTLVNGRETTRRAAA